METSSNDKQTQDLLLHELMKCSRLIMASAHKNLNRPNDESPHRHNKRGCGRGKNCNGEFGHEGHHRHHHHHDIKKIGQGRLLSFLLEQDGISQKDLAELLKIAPASVSELINKLENSGYIQKNQNETDKRITNIFLTEGGRFFAEKMKEERTELASGIFAALSEDEQKLLLSLLQKIINCLDGSEDEIRFGCRFR